MSAPAWVQCVGFRKFQVFRGVLSRLGAGSWIPWILPGDAEIPSGFRARESFGRSWQRGKKLGEGQRFGGDGERGRKGLAVRVEAPPWCSLGSARSSFELWSCREGKGWEAGMGGMRRSLRHSIIH